MIPADPALDVARAVARRARAGVVTRSQSAYRRAIPARERAHFPRGWALALRLRWIVPIAGGRFVAGPDQP